MKKTTKLSSAKIIRPVTGGIAGTTIGGLIGSKIGIAALGTAITGAILLAKKWKKS